MYVILPALDEARSIGGIIGRFAAVQQRDGRPYRLVLVDDGSSDGTAEVATRAADEAGIELIVLRHAVNHGLGAAIRTGVLWCLDHAAADDVIAMLDADDTHPPDLLPGMWDLAAQGNDVVIASRYQAGAKVLGVPPERRLLSGGGRVLFRLAFPIPGVRDYTCGYRVYRVAALRRAHVIYGDRLCSESGFEATVDLLLRLREAGITAAEVPLVLDYRHRVGASKMRVWRTIRATTWLLGRRWVERLTIYRPERVQARLAAHERRLAQ
jgi:dolichol-phosphate mannosyltransferase